MEGWGGCLHPSIHSVNKFLKHALDAIEERAILVLHASEPQRPNALFGSSGGQRFYEVQAHPLQSMRYSV